jgi:hypothetical protein
VNENGKEIIPPTYDYIEGFDENLVKVKLRQKTFYVQLFPDGKVVEYYEE